MGTRAQGYKSLCELAGDLLISPETEYATMRSTLKFHCNQCREVFVTTPFLYKKSEDGKRCIKCKQKLQVNSVSARDVFIERCKKTHGSYYSYDKVSDVFQAHDSITIICPKHGEFQQTADQHSRGSGCRICKMDKITGATRKDITTFIVQANEVHNFRYNYTKAEYVNATTHLTIMCSKHGEFQQTPDIHLRGSGCPLCTNTSAPVLSIINTLTELNIAYAIEKMFAGCVGAGGGNKPLRFDIYLPDRNLCIEYDGLHHFQPVIYGNMTHEQAEQRFIIQQQNDEIKNKFCEDNNIQLVRIPYTVHHPEAFIRKYLSTEIEASRYYYSWDMLNQDVAKIANYIKSFGYERFAVYGIARGGVAFSVPLSYHFDDVSEYGIVTFQRYDGNTKKVRFDITHPTHDLPIFVIDDLISSGITMQKTVQALKHKFKKAIVHPVVIFGEENDNDVFFIREHPKQWIVFPYEV